MKKKVITFIIILLCLLLPVAVAFGIIMKNLSPDPAEGTVSSISLSFEEREQRVEDKKEIEFFISAVKSGSPIEKTAHPLEQYRHLEIVFHKLNHDVSYHVYLSDSENDCVYTDGEGNLFLFSAQTAKTLQGHPLLGGYGLSFSDCPTVSVINQEVEYKGEKVKGEWNYIDSDGKEKNDKISLSGESKAVLSRGEDLCLQFSIQPDYCGILLLNEKGEILYSGPYDEIKPIDLEKDSNLTLSVTCDWYEDKERSYHGSLEYEFHLFYDLKTECELSTTVLAPGEELVVRVLHSSSPQIAVTPAFSTDGVKVKKIGDVWEATVTVSSAAKEGESSVMVMGSDIDEAFPVTILPAA